MLGHKLWQTCAPRFETHATFRRALRFPICLGILDESRMLEGVFVEEFDTVAKAFAQVRPEVVVNSVGIVKQNAAANNPVASITVNSLFPHRLANLCRDSGARLIHLSTDCVFSGRTGNYREDDLTDAQDLYGRTKVLGEVDYENCLTLRTSMIGRELQSSHGLIEWFLAQRGKTVRGFKRAVFSGFTTAALADVIGDIIADHPQLRGTWHVAADSINKFDLLSLVKQTYELDVQIEPDETFICDRSLDDGRFRQATGFAPRPWLEMIRQMAQDTTPYEEIRRNHAG
ncbi:MAG: SDR family oxidoreductase [Acidobacteriota bacterium]|nr:SDR family oxidoreductase [Acidobacteriota bacterium]